MTDLTTTYLGLKLKNPVVASASPLSEQIDAIRRMEDAGAAAVVLHSLFEEQIHLHAHHLDHGLSQGTDSFAESLSYFPDLEHYKLGPDRYLEHIRLAKEAVDMPIIASLNGVTPGGWTLFAKQMEAAGADALELNVYDLVTDPERSGVDVENGYVDLIGMVRSTVEIPIAVKLSPFFSSIPHMARRLAGAGADALVLFNRFYQPDLDIENLEITPSLDLSHSRELRARLRWVAILYGQNEMDLAVTGGVHTAEDVLKTLMAGGKVARMTSALLSNGIKHLTYVLRDLEAWMEEREYVSVEEMRGSLSHRNAEAGDRLERANYMKVLNAFMPRTYS
jgi:dihydroorotate dehydrogenase (fumarate)